MGSNKSINTHLFWDVLITNVPRTEKLKNDKDQDTYHGEWLGLQCGFSYVQMYQRHKREPGARNTVQCRVPPGPTKVLVQSPKL